MVTTDSQSNIEDNTMGREQDSTPHLTYSERFYEAFPQYLAIGMTYEQFWEQDCTLVVAYRKAEEIRNEKRNQELWLQGMYVYEAICDASPILRPFGKKGTKPQKYPSEPYVINSRQQSEMSDKKERKTFNKGLAVMESLIKSMNKKFSNADEKEVSDNADN